MRVPRSAASLTRHFASVTTKLGALNKGFLLKWFADLGWFEAKRRVREAADRGTRIHFAWYTVCTGGAIVYQNPHDPAYTPKELVEIHQKYDGKVWTLQNQEEHYDFLKLVQMKEILNPEILESEKKVYNIEHQEAGTADNILRIKEGEYPISGKTPLKLPSGLFMFDAKSGNYVGVDNFMQVSAYVHCAESMGYERFTGALIAHTAAQMKNGIEGFKVYYLTREEIDQYYQDYRDIARVWVRQNKDSKPTIRQLPCLVAFHKDEVKLVPKPEPPKKEPIKEEDKSKKKKFSDSVILTVDEYDKLVKQFGKAGTYEKINNLNNYIMSKGKKYKSHYHTILNWERMNDPSPAQKKML